MIDNDSLPHNPGEILEMKLRDITKERSEDGLLDRLDAEIDTTDWDDANKDRVFAALTIALELHKDDTRGPHPNSTHILRVAIRIVSKSHFAIRDSPDLLVAALLHDTVEDHPEDYLASPDEMSKEEMRLAAFDSVGVLFGDHVKHLVSKLTNPVVDSSLPKSERNELYRQHVIEVLEEEPKAGIIKLSDFIDNCAGLKHNESAKKARKLAHKYYTLIPYFRIFIDKSEYLNPSVKESLSKQLDRAEERCEERMIDNDIEEYRVSA